MTGRDDDPQRTPSRRELVVEAAIEAELHTGGVEPDLATARSHVLWRLARMSIGTLLTLAGLAMLVLPGPGLLVVVAGLAVLARDVAWAERVLAQVRHRVPSDADGTIATKTWVFMGVSVAVGLSLSIWFMLR